MMRQHHSLKGRVMPSRLHCFKPDGVAFPTFLNLPNNGQDRFVSPLGCADAAKMAPDACPPSRGAVGSAVIEAAILATRLEFLDHDLIRDQFQQLATVVEKTAGPAESRAFDGLVRFVTPRLQPRDANALTRMP